MGQALGMAVPKDLKAKDAFMRTRSPNPTAPMFDFDDSDFFLKPKNQKYLQRKKNLEDLISDEEISALKSQIWKSLSNRNK